jgi:hypothetical protein
MCIACDYDSGSVLVGRAEVRGSALQCCVQFARCFLMAKSIAPWLIREQLSENRAANPITIQASQRQWPLIACAMRVCTHVQDFAISCLVRMRVLPSRLCLTPFSPPRTAIETQPRRGRQSTAALSRLLPTPQPMHLFQSHWNTSASTQTMLSVASSRTRPSATD